MIGCQGVIKLFKSLSSKTIRGMKQVLCKHDADIILYINCVFAPIRFWGKLEIAFYCFVTTDISTKVFPNKFLNSPLSDFVQITEFNCLSWQNRCLIFYQAKPWLNIQVSVVVMCLWFLFGTGCQTRAVIMFCLN